MADTPQHGSGRTLTVAVPAALAQSRIDVTVLLLLLLVCWILFVLLIVTPRGRQRRVWPDDGWHETAVGPWTQPDESPADEVDTATLRTATEAVAVSALPTLADITGHRLAAAQLADMVGPMLRAGARPHQRPPGGVVLHGGTPADRALLVRAAAGEHGVRVVWVPVNALARSPINSAVEDAFVDARAHAPCVLVLADLDRLASGAAPPLRRVASDLLTQLRSLDAAERIAVVGLAGDRDAVPRPLRDTGGLDRQIAVGTLTATERRRIIIRELALHAAEHVGDVEASVQITNGLTAVQLRTAVADAVRAVRVQGDGAGRLSRITPRDLRAAVADPDMAPAIVLAAFGSDVARRLRRLLASLRGPDAGPALTLIAAGGDGKTAAARWMARRSPRPVIWLDASDLAVLLAPDLDAIAASAVSQAPVLVVIDGVDDAVAAYDDMVDRKRLAAAIDRIVDARGVALLLTARDRWAPPGAADVEDAIDTLHLRHPTYHDRVLLVRHAAPDLGLTAAAVAAAGLSGATRREVIAAAAHPDDQAA